MIAPSAVEAMNASETPAPAPRPELCVDLNGQVVSLGDCPTLTNPPIVTLPISVPVIEITVPVIAVTPTSPPAPAAPVTQPATTQPASTTPPGTVPGSTTETTAAPSLAGVGLTVGGDAGLPTGNVPIVSDISASAGGTSAVSLQTGQNTLLDVASQLLPSGSLAGLNLFSLMPNGGDLFLDDPQLDVDLCLPWLVLTEVSEECAADPDLVPASIDADVCLPLITGGTASAEVAGVVGDVNAECQDDAGIGGSFVAGTGGSLVNANVCAVLSLLGDASGVCPVGDGGGLIDVDACVIAGLLGDASAVCSPQTTTPGGPTTVPVTPTTTPGGETPTTTPGRGNTDDDAGGATGTTTPGGTSGFRNPGDARSLPTTGLAIAGTLLLAGVLVAGGIGTKRLGRRDS